jgi:hypothetical protein
MLFTENKINPRRFDKLINRVCILFAILIFIYVFLRALYVPPFSDEVTTFFFYIQPGSFQPYHSHLDANNHVLNSLFARLAYLFFGDHIFILRLPNLIGFLFYLFFAWKMKTHFKSRIIWAFCFIVLISAPYFLDFFNICRGYGMSMAFLLGSCYHLVEYRIQSKMKNLLLGFLFCSLSLWANLSVMIIIFLLISLFLFFIIKKMVKKFRWTEFIISISGFLILALFPIIYAVLFSFELRNKGMLYLGQDGLFVNTTVSSLVKEFFSPFQINWYFFWFIFGCYLVLTIYSLFRKQVTRAFIPLQLLFWGTVTGTILLHHILAVNYTVERAAVHFFLLWMLTFFITIDQVSLKISVPLAIIPVIFFTGQLVFVANLRYLQHWKYEAIPFSYYRYMEEWKNKNEKLPTISAPFLQKSVLAWHDYKNNGQLNSAQETGYPDTLADFIIGSYQMNGICPHGYDTVLFDNGSKVSLLKRTDPVSWDLVKIYKIKEALKGEEYIPIIKLSADTFVDHSFLFDIKFYAQSDFFPMDWFLVCDVLDSSGMKICSEYIDLQMTLPDFSKPSLVQKRIFIHKVPQNSLDINFLIWDPDKKAATLSNLELRTYIHR